MPLQPRLQKANGASSSPCPLGGIELPLQVTSSSNYNIILMNNNTHHPHSYAQNVETLDETVWSQMLEDPLETTTTTPAAPPAATATADATAAVDATLAATCACADPAAAFTATCAACAAATAAPATTAPATLATTTTATGTDRDETLDYTAFSQLDTTPTLLTDKGNGVSDPPCPLGGIGLPEQVMIISDIKPILHKLIL